RWGRPAAPPTTPGPSVPRSVGPSLPEVTSAPNPPGRRRAHRPARQSPELTGRPPDPRIRLWWTAGCCSSRFLVDEFPLQGSRHEGAPRRPPDTSDHGLIPPAAAT